MCLCLQLYGVLSMYVCMYVQLYVLYVCMMYVSVYVCMYACMCCSMQGGGPKQNSQRVWLACVFDHPWSKAQGIIARVVICMTFCCNLYPPCSDKGTTFLPLFLVEQKQAPYDTTPRTSALLSRLAWLARSVLASTLVGPPALAVAVHFDLSS